MRGSKHVLVAATLLIGCPMLAHANLEGEVLVGYSLGYNDNIQGASTDQSADENISNELYFDVDISKPDGFFRYDVFGTAGFQFNTSDVLDDDVELSGGVNGLWIIAPNRLTWSISDVASVRRRNARGIATDANTEQANFLTTGPNLQFRLSGRSTLDLGAYYQQSWFEFGDSNEYVGYNANHLYLPSNLSRVSTQLSQVHFLPDTNFDSDSVNTSASIQYDRRTQFGAWYLGAGLSQITLDDQIEGLNDDVVPTFTAGFNRQVSRRVTWNISGRRQITTIGDNALSRTNRESLSQSITTSAPVLRPEISDFELDNLRSEIDNFRYGAGFNVDTSIQTSLLWQHGQWAASVEVYRRELDVPEFQIDLSQDARQLLFPGGTLDAGQSSQGVSFRMSLEPKVRWLVDLGLRIEDRDIQSVEITEENASLASAATSEVRETILQSGVSFAATRFLSFGGQLQAAVLEDKSGDDADLRNNEILLSVEYSL